MVETEELIKLAQATNEAKREADKLGLEFVSHLLLMTLLEIARIETLERKQGLYDLN